MYVIPYFIFKFHVTFIKRVIFLFHKIMWWPTDFLKAFSESLSFTSHPPPFLFSLWELLSGLSEALSRPAKLLSQASWNPATLQDLQFHLMARFTLNLNCNFGYCYKPRKCSCNGWRWLLVWSRERRYVSVACVVGPLAHSFTLWQLSFISKS